MLCARRIVLSIVSCFVILAATASAQTPAAGKPAALSHEQQLQAADYAKDVKLAAQQIELEKVQLAGAIVQERRSATVFNQYLGQLRTQLHAPASDWDFDLSSLQFVPKGQATKTASKATSSATGSGGQAAAMTGQGSAQGSAKAR